jgi:hypothetical protein
MRSEIGSQITQFRVAREKLKTVISLKKGINQLEIAEISGALENGKRLLLLRSENDLKDDSRNRGLREIALLHARLRFEDGLYSLLSAHLGWISLNLTIRSVG